MSEPALATEIDDFLRRARDGDDQSLADLLARCRPYLTVLARMQRSRRLQARFDESDIVQDAVTLAHRDFPQFRGKHEAEFTAWLRQILARVAASSARSHLRECRDVRLERQLQADFGQSSIALGAALATADSSPSERAGRRERAVLLAQALQELPEHYREALILHQLEGMTTGEIAQRMGRSVDSVQKLLARGLMQLRTLLSKSL